MINNEEKNISFTRAMSRKALLLMAAVIIATGASMALPSMSPAPDDPVEEAPLSPVEDASESYKAMKQLQFDGAESQVVDSAVYSVYEKTYAALASETLCEASTDQCRGILMDINTAIARAAINAQMRGDNAALVKLARAYVDTHLMPQMATAEFHRDPQLYPSMLYVAASGCYNQGQKEDALRYFEEYIKTGEVKNRETICLFYGQTLLQTGQQSRGLETVVAASNEFPANVQLLTIAMQLALDTNRRDLLPPMLERALAFKPNDEKLLNLQAEVFEENNKYREALDIYTRLQETHPNSINITEDVARCYYNLGTSYYNESIRAVNEKDVARARRQSNAYFSNAVDTYEMLIANDPNNIKYLKALGMAYATLGNKSKVEANNAQLAALGQSQITMNSMPVMMGSDGQSKATGDNGEAAPRNIPSYQEYAEAFVTEGLAKWYKKGEFEKTEDYNQRTSAAGILAEQKRLSAIAADNYLNQYGGHLSLSELKLQPYDVENETYAIHSDFGPLYINVPLKNKEAEVFKSSWEQVQIRNAKFIVQDNAIAISTITFHTPYGKDYTYNSSKSVNYQAPVAEVNIDKIKQAIGPVVAPTKPGKPQAYVPKVISDVDKNIPQNQQTNLNTIAMIIANENYGKVSQVESARHDGDVFAQYCRETLGIPYNQVLVFSDATYGNLLSAINQLRNSVQAMGPGTDVIVYYAGHGVPDEKTSEAYMLPTDADPMVTATALPLSQFYDALNSMGAANVMVFMDACFSGANRGDGMLASARGVVLKAKAAAPKGNMFVLSAADGNETALPWKEKDHGLFTYYLLKKLQESKGDASLQEIADYVSQQVRKTASLQLNKPQTPRMSVSGALAGQLSSKKLR